MSLYGDYIKEHRNDEIIENDDGFATYRYLNNGKSVYILDIYTKPSNRKSHIAASFADQIVAIAKEKGATELFGTVQPAANNSHISMLVLLAYGLKPSGMINDSVIFRKDI